MKFIACLTGLLIIAFSALAQCDVARWENRLREAHVDSVRVDIYDSIFSYYQYLNPDTSVYFLERGLKEFTEKNHPYGIASLTTFLALQDGIQGRIELARERYASALKLFTQLNNRKGIASVYTGLGILGGRTGNYDDAVRDLMKALKEYELLNDSDAIISTYLKLGVINEESNNLDKALEYFNIVYKQVQSQPEKSMYALVLNNIGIVYGKKGDMPKAISYFEQALKATDKPNFIGQRIAALTNLGIAYDNLGDQKKALGYFDEGLAITKDRNLPEDHIRLLINRSSVVRKGDPAKAIETLKEAEEMTKKIGQKLLLVDIYDDMTDMYVQLNDYKNAFLAFRTERRLADSLYSIDKAKEMANLQSVYELERSNAKVNELQALSKKNMLKRNIIIVAAGILAITLILLLFMYRKSKSLNELLTKREKELQKSNEIKDKLFSIIGHDLRGPVGNIPLMLQMLKSDAQFEGEKKYLIDNLIEHSEASTETLDKLLYWGQSQIKGIGIKQVPFMTKGHIQNCIKLLKNSADQKQITIADKTPDDTVVYADTAHFEFFIRNLLSNAVKFTHPGGHIAIEAYKNKKEGFVVFAVKDNGMGIGKEDAAHIFEPFRSTIVGTANEKGTSIGLMLCKEFVEENGGEIWVESEPGKGSDFYFSLKMPV